MGRIPIMEVLNASQDLLVQRFNREELRALLLFKMGINLHEIAPNATGTNDLVFEVLTWMDRRGLLYDLIRAAANDRPKVPEWQTLLAKVNDSSAAPSPPSPPISGSQVGLRGKSPPDEIIALVRGHSRLCWALPNGDEKTVQLQAIVNQLLGLSLEDYDLADRYHLGVDEGDRLLAILTLVRRPDARYLHWLAERIYVESRFVGYQSAVALVAAANALPFADLDAVMKAIDCAREWIPPDERQDKGRWKKLGQALEVVTQRSVGEHSRNTSSESTP